MRAALVSCAMIPAMVSSGVSEGQMTHGEIFHCFHKLLISLSPRAYFHISTIQFNPSSVLAQHSEYPSLPFKYGGAALLVQTIPPLHFFDTFV